MLDTCLLHKVPVAAAIGGGYSSERALVVERHLVLHMAASTRAEQFLQLGQVDVDYTKWEERIHS